MSTARDIVTYLVTPNEYQILEPYIDSSNRGGVSRIVENRSDRLAQCYAHQQAGKFGEWALMGHLFGRGAVPEMFTHHRDLLDMNPLVGDGGQDIPGYRIDVKCSGKKPNTDTMRYNLLIAAEEFHQNWCYVLAVSALYYDRYRVEFVGWATSAEIGECRYCLPLQRTDLQNKNRHWLPAAALHPMKDFRVEDFRITDHASTGTSG